MKTRSATVLAVLMMLLCALALVPVTAASAHSTVRSATRAVVKRVFIGSPFLARQEMSRTGCAHRVMLISWTETLLSGCGLRFAVRPWRVPSLYRHRESCPDTATRP